MGPSPCNHGSVGKSGAAQSGAPSEGLEVFRAAGRTSVLQSLCSVLLSGAPQSGAQSKVIAVCRQHRNKGLRAQSPWHTASG